MSNFQKFQSKKKLFSSKKLRAYTSSLKKSEISARFLFVTRLTFKAKKGDSIIETPWANWEN